MTGPETRLKTNRLIDETSPYLQQHAHNPVDWFPWGSEALEKAIHEHKPIFLSIGYSACHWCHVMRRESFENEETADYLNTHFVSIKVDREERPDLDHIYQTAAQLLTGQGGWPLSIFMTPQLEPFFAGTYFPPQERYGYPSLLTVLKAVQAAFASKREALVAKAAQVTRMISLKKDSDHLDAADLDRKTVVLAVTTLAHHIDKHFGGFGDHPKFPHTQALELLLRQHGSEAGEEYVRLATFTLRRMAQGGLYDQLGGGFHRYSTDRQWRIPHFEKMLYDNALLPPLYLLAYQITSEEYLATVARETLDYVLREMTHSEGAFFSTQDADSEGEEGKFYVWRLDELRKILSPEDADLTAAFYGVTEQGNFANDTNVLYRAHEIERLAERLGADQKELRARLQICRARLHDARQQRVAPHRDEKLLTAWNGLMISAMARAAAILGEERYTQAAVRSLQFIWECLRQPDGRLRRSWRESLSVTPGFLEDYAFLSQALLDVYHLTFDEEYLDQAQELMSVCVDLFWDEPNGGFFLAPDTPDLIHRPKTAQDQSVPSGNAVAAQVLLRLHSYDEHGGYLRRVEKLLRVFRADMEQDPWATAGVVGALDNYLAGALQVAIIRTPMSAESTVHEMLSAVRAAYHPFATICVVDEEAAHKLSISEGKSAYCGQATAYVCQGFTCSAPIIEANDLRSRARYAWHPAIS